MCKKQQGITSLIFKVLKDINVKRICTLSVQLITYVVIKVIMLVLHIEIKMQCYITKLIFDNFVLLANWGN